MIAITTTLEAAIWYDNERPGLGDEFVAEFEQCMMRIAADPNSYSIVRNKVRRALMHRFPYSVYYLCEKDLCIITACFHGKRSSDALKQRLGL